MDGNDDEEGLDCDGRLRRGFWPLVDKLDDNVIRDNRETALGNLMVGVYTICFAYLVSHVIIIQSSGPWTTM